MARRLRRWTDTEKTQEEHDSALPERLSLHTDRRSLARLLTGFALHSSEACHACSEVYRADTLRRVLLRGNHTTACHKLPRSCGSCQVGLLIVCWKAVVGTACYRRSLFATHCPRIRYARRKARLHSLPAPHYDPLLAAKLSCTLFTAVTLSNQKANLLSTPTLNLNTTSKPAPRHTSQVAVRNQASVRSAASIISVHYFESGRRSMSAEQQAKMSGNCRLGGDSGAASLYVRRRAVFCRCTLSVCAYNASPSRQR